MLPILLPLAARVNTLLTRISSTRAALLDNLDEAISAISPIQSIQEGTITIANGSTSGTATITSVTTGKTALHLLGIRCNSSVTTFTDYGAEISLTNSTTVTANRNGGTGQLVIRFRAVTYK